MTPRPPNRPALRSLFFVGFAVAAGAWHARGATITRSLPAHYIPGTAVEVTLTVVPDPGHRVYAVTESFPAHWSVGAISHAGSLDVFNRVVKWGPFLDAIPRTFSYEATPRAGSAGTEVFDGTAWFEDHSMQTAGDRSTTRFPGKIIRVQPTDYLPGVELEVALQVIPAADVQAWAAEEAIPVGWEATTISASGELDASSRKIKWGPFLDAAPRTLNYIIRPPADFRFAVGLSVHARFDAASVTESMPLVPRPSRVSRTAPSTYVPGTEFTVILEATPAPYVQVYAVEDDVPKGWMPSAISAGGVFDAVQSRVKWGPFSEPPLGPRNCSYHLVPPSSAVETFALRGRGRFDSEEVINDQTLTRFRLRVESLLTRSLPPDYTPGVELSVSVQVDPVDDALVYSVEEQVPAGWAVADVNHGGGFDSTHRRVKWGPFFDETATPRTLSYTVVPLPNSSGDAHFDGLGRFDQVSLAIGGPNRLPAKPSTMTRAAPARYTPGIPLVVMLTVSPGPGTEAQAVEEAIPPGWTASGMTDGGAVDPISRRLKWGPFADAHLRTLRYTLTPPITATGEHLLTGQGFSNGDSVEVAGDAILGFNASPFVTPDAVTRRPGEATKISALKLLANDFDPENDFLEILEVDPVTALGGTLDFIWPWLYYTPPPGPDVVDSFTYLAADPFGGAGTGDVRILIDTPAVGPAQNILSIEVLPNGFRRIRFAGVPGLLYRVEASTDLVSWVRLGSVMAGPAGDFSWDDSETELYPMRFYRSSWP